MTTRATYHHSVVLPEELEQAWQTMRTDRQRAGLPVPTFNGLVVRLLYDELKQHLERASPAV